MSAVQVGSRPNDAQAMTYDRLLAQAMRDHALPRAEARILLAAASRRTGEWLIAHGDEVPSGDAAGRFAALAARRGNGEPVAYLTGLREFHGRPFRVGPAVLIPRPETECLVTTALAALAGIEAPRVLDLGTGSGAIAVTLALERPDATMIATDCSEDALALARANAAALGAGGIAFRAGDWWQALPADEPPFHLVVSNPPYVADADPHLAQGDLRFEPRGALAAGPDGGDALRRIVAGAAPRLAHGGRLLLEHGFEQGPLCRALLLAHGFDEVRTLPDLAGLPRVTVGRRALLGHDDGSAQSPGICLHRPVSVS